MDRTEILREALAFLLSEFKCHNLYKDNLLDADEVINLLKEHGMVFHIATVEQIEDRYGYYVEFEELDLKG